MDAIFIHRILCQQDNKVYCAANAGKTSLLVQKAWMYHLECLHTLSFSCSILLAITILKPSRPSMWRDSARPIAFSSLWPLPEAMATDRSAACQTGKLKSKTHNQPQNSSYIWDYLRWTIHKQDFHWVQKTNAPGQRPPVSKCLTLLSLEHL